MRNLLGMPRLTAGLLAALCVVMTLNPIVASGYLPALGVMAGELGTTIAGIQLTLTAFFLGVAVGQVVAGALSDALGRRRVVLFAFAALTAAGVVVAVAPTLEVMIAGRVLQGLGASAGVVVVRAIVSDLGRGPEIPRAYSLLTGTLAAGPLLAAFGGTVLLQAAGWRAPLVGILVASAGFLVLAAVRIPESLPRERRAPLRLARMAASYGRLLRDPVYVGNALTMAFVFAGLTVHVSASSFVAQDVLGADAWGFWIMYSVYALAVLVGGWANAPLSVRFGARRMLTIELLVALTATAALAAVSVAGVLTVASYLPLIVVGCGCVAGAMANATTLTLGRAAFAAGAGAALMGCIQFTLGAASSPLGGLAGPHTAVPMGIGMLACYALSLAASRFARFSESRDRGFPPVENPPAPAGPGAAL